MRPRTVVVRFEWHVLERGVWRDCCMLPSGARMVCVNAATLRPISSRGRRLEIVWCDECGGQERL